MCAGMVDIIKVSLLTWLMQRRFAEGSARTQKNPKKKDYGRGGSGITDIQKKILRVDIFRNEINENGICF